MKKIKLGTLYEQKDRWCVYGKKGIAPVLTAAMGSGGGHTPMVIDTWLSYKAVKYITSPKRGMTTNINPNICMTLTAKGQSNWIGSFISPDIDHLEKNGEIGGKAPVKIIMKNGDTLINDGERIMKNTYEINNEEYSIRIRKLTPKECWRLMGFDDESFNRAEQVCSNTRLYKQAGNSIVVPVLEQIFKELL